MLQAFLGFAYTIQQEFHKLRRDTAAMIQSLAPEQFAASVQRGFPAALQRIVAGAQTLTEATGAAIALGNEQSMVCVARSGNSAPNLGSRFNALSGLSGECIRTRESVICMNAAADPRVDYTACTALGVKSMLYLPLLSDGKLIGILAVFSPRAQHFSHRDIGTLRWTQALIAESLQHNSRMQVGAGSLIPAAPHREAETVEQFQSPETVAAAVPIPPVTPAEVSDRPKPTFVGTIVDESVAEFEEPSSKADSSGENRLPVLIAIVIILMFLAGIGFMSINRLSSAKAPAPASIMNAAAPASEPVATPAEESLLKPVSTEEVKPSANLPQAVHLAASPSLVVLSIDLPRRVAYEGFSINGPNRVYFDLYGVNLVGAEGASVPTSGGLVSRIRISAYKPGITRIVFDLSNRASFGVKVAEATNSLSIELREKTASDEDAISPRPGEVVKITSAGRTILRVPGDTAPDVSR
ncbi:MAG TPA: GAF domain-containing protein [Terriglobales bacterium]|nr:GAF domain-containing protein [Terriglobales bacterium]